MTTARDSRTAFGLKILNSTHPDVRRLKRDGNIPEIHGHKFWNSSFLIMNYLKKNPLPPRSRVMEMGCGWGLLGIYCAKNFDARVTGTDADKNVFPFLHLHAEINGVKVKTEAARFENLTVERLKKVDVLFGADVCFWDELTPVLFNLIKRARKAGVKKIIISDPSRSPFTELAKRCKDSYDDASVIARSLVRPVRATGELLIIEP
ncbi:MAG: methyltransferase domain-containing protein [Myxococcota bacterium]|jgi:predicted nicotinamide N-methyase|nr:methyltransferase domain-containing protein [Myxococcota bacterium]